MFSNRNTKKVNYKTGEKALTPRQQEKLLASIDRYRDEVLLRLSLSLGTRRSDIVRITWNNINEEDCSITYLEKKKGDNPHTAFVSSEIIQMLKKWKEFTRGPYVFPGERGNHHLSSKTAYNIFNAAMRRAGIIRKDENWPFHALRATAIKNAQRAGWSPEEAAAHVNDSLKVIQEHYTVPSILERQEAAMKKPIA